MLASASKRSSWGFKFQNEICENDESCADPRELACAEQSATEAGVVAGPFLLV